MQRYTCGFGVALTVGAFFLLSACKDDKASPQTADAAEEEEDEMAGGRGGSGGSQTGGTGGGRDASVANDARSADGPAPDTAPAEAKLYNPCPARGTPCRVMPYGDSITDGLIGARDQAGYRTRLFRLAVKNARTMTLVGRNMSGPETVEGQPFPRSHEGYGGYTIDVNDEREGISSLLPAAIEEAKPHIVLLMIGTNDVNIKIDLNNAPARLGSLMDKIIAADPNLLLVVAKIVPSYDDDLNVRIRAYNAAIPALVKARTDAGKHVVMVDMYSAFTAEPGYKDKFFNDDLHPSEAGYDRMAEVWYAAIGSLLK